MSIPGKRQTIPFILWASLLLLALSPVHSAASTLTIAWDPNIEEDLAGYRVYYGTQSGNYDSVIDVGNITQYTVTDLEPGTRYYLALTAYDTSWNESDFSDEVSGIPTGPTNNPPTANAGPDQTVNEGVTVTLDASNSSDPDDGIASYLWEQTGGIPVTLSDPTEVQTTFTSPDVGSSGASLTFRLTVTDNGGLKSTDTCIVNVTLENISPTADAGPDLVVDEGVMVTLDASNSSDPDDGIASYLWEQTGGIPVTLSDPTAIQPTFTSPDVGSSGSSLTFRLTVTDNGGLQDTDTCIVNVTWVNIPPTANAGPGQTVNEGVTVTLDASNSSDPDDGIASYLWEQTGGIPVTLSDPTEVQTTFTSPDVGSSGASLTFRLTVTDNGGLKSTDACTVNVTLENIAPTADAGPDLVVDEGVMVTLDASNSSDPDDGIASYLWEQTGGIPVTLSDPTEVQTTFISPDVGSSGSSLTFRLTVTDNGGLKSTDTCIVNVTLENIPPTADAGPDLVVDKGVMVTLDASNSSDPDDGIASYLWEETTGMPVTLSDPTIINPTFVAPSFSDDDMILSFQLTVTDNAGLQSSDKSFIIVEGDSKDGYSGWGCFVATAAYGSYLNPHVKILRDFRDEYLMSNPLGGKFVDLYYQYGPRIANHIGKYGFLQILSRQALLPLIGISSLFLKATVLSKIILLFLCLFLISAFTLRSSKSRII